MSCDWNRIRKNREKIMALEQAIDKCQWNDVLNMVEQQPLLLFWDEVGGEMGENLFLRVWEEDRWVGRDCVRILFRHPELARCVGVNNYGRSTFNVGVLEYSVSGTLLGFLVGAGEVDLVKEGLEIGLDPDGWKGANWYRDETGLYHFRYSATCTIQKEKWLNPRGIMGVDRLPKETTPLLIAIFKENVDLVKLLIRHGASFSFQWALCQRYVEDCSSWTIRNLLKEAYGGGNK